MIDKILISILLFIIIAAIAMIIVNVVDDNYGIPDLMDETIKCGQLGYDKAFIENDSGFGNWSIYCGHLMEEK